MIPTLIVGAGGHGRVVLDILRAMGAAAIPGAPEPIGFIDADPALHGKVIDGLPVLGAVNMLPRLLATARHALVAIGDNGARITHAQKITAAGLELVRAVHPSASVSPTALLGVNLVIGPQAHVGTGVRLGDSVIVNSGAIVEHECQIDEGVHIAPGAALAGRVRVARGAFVGLGARVIQCLSIGELATVGAGAVVIRDVPPGTTVVGVPARTLPESNDQLLA